MLGQSSVRHLCYPVKQPTVRVCVPCARPTGFQNGLDRVEHLRLPFSSLSQQNIISITVYPLHQTGNEGIDPEQLVNLIVVFGM